MKKWWIIRNTGVNILSLLELIGKGYTYEQILKEYPQLTIQDINYAINFAHDLLVRFYIYDSLFDTDNKLEQVSFRIPAIVSDRHIKKLFKWSEDEDNELVKLYRNGARFKDIAMILQRPESSIKARLREMGLYS